MVNVGIGGDNGAIGGRGVLNVEVEPIVVVERE